MNMVIQSGLFNSKHFLTLQPPPSLPQRTHEIKIAQKVVSNILKQNVIPIISKQCFKLVIFDFNLNLK